MQGPVFIPRLARDALSLSKGRPVPLLGASSQRRDCFANHSLSGRRRVLNPKGIYIGVGGPQSRWMIGLLVRPLKALVLSPFVSQKLVTVLARPNKEDLTTMRELMATGKVKPVIDKWYSLVEVPEAIRYLAKGRP